MRLELGAGDRPTEGFVHNDMRRLPDIEIVGDASRISFHPQVGLAACDEIRATHILEHFSFLKTRDVLRDWWEALRPGGRLYVEVPCLFNHFDYFKRGEITARQLVSYVYGDQDYEGNAHYAGFDAQILREDLEAAGFECVSINDIGMVLCAECFKPEVENA